MPDVNIDNNYCDVGPFRVTRRDRGPIGKCFILEDTDPCTPMALEAYSDALRMLDRKTTADQVDRFILEVRALQNGPLVKQIKIMIATGFDDETICKQYGITPYVLDRIRQQNKLRLLIGDSC